MGTVVVTGGSEADWVVDSLALGTEIEGLLGGLVAVVLVLRDASVPDGSRPSLRVARPEAVWVDLDGPAVECTGLAIWLAAVEGACEGAALLAGGAAPIWDCPAGIRTAHPMIATVIVTAAATSPPIR